MPREKKENNNSSNLNPNLNLSYTLKIQDQKQNQSLDKKNTNIINIEGNNDIDMKNTQNQNQIQNQIPKKKLPFKNPSFISKYKNKDRPIKTSKTTKNLIIDNFDSISLNICIYIIKNKFR